MSTRRFLLYGSGRGLLEVRNPDGSRLGCGLIVRAEGHPTTAARDVRTRLPHVFLGVDAGAWRRGHASPDHPMELADDGLLPVSVDMYASSVAGAGADLVLTPSLFVATDDWASLKAVLAAGRTSERGDVRTLVATDADMLTGSRFDQLVDLLSEGADRALTLAFAAGGAPLASRSRLVALRRLLELLPATTVLATDVLVASDVVSRGGVAACGINSSNRQPRRPGAGGGPRSKDYIPGTFLRDLWETRNPHFYEQWYANLRSPTCAGCGGRRVDRFARAPAEIQSIVDHHVHSWLAIDSELAGAGSEGAATWLAAERRRALETHLELRPIRALHDADKALQALCALDDPQWWRTLSPRRSV